MGGPCQVMSPARAQALACCRVWLLSSVRACCVLNGPDRSLGLPSCSAMLARAQLCLRVWDRVCQAQPLRVVSCLSALSRSELHAVCCLSGGRQHCPWQIALLQPHMPWFVSSCRAMGIRGSHQIARQRPPRHAEHSRQLHGRSISRGGGQLPEQGCGGACTSR